MGIKPTVVTYRGTPQATQDLLAGNVDFLCNQIVNIVETGAYERHLAALRPFPSSVARLEAVFAAEEVVRDARDHGLASVATGVNADDAHCEAWTRDAAAAVERLLHGE